MAQVITDQDLNNPNQQNQNQNQNGVQTNQSSSGQSPQQQGNAQIAQNYSGGAGGGAGGQGAQPAPAANPNAQKGSGYTNIQRIVQANQGNKLGSTIGSNIQNAAQQTQGNINQAQQQFQQQAGANRADTNQNAQLVQQALANPTGITGNQNQVSQFQNLLSGTYQGPKGLQNAAQLQAQAQDVGQLGQATTSEGGKQGLLQRFVGAPQYNSGQQTLDSLLLGATGGKDLAAARRATVGVEGQQKQAQQGAAQTAQEYAQRAQQFGQNVQGQFGDTVAKQQQGLAQQAQTAQQGRDAQVAALQQQLGQGNINKDIANQLGITQGQQTYNITPDKFVSENAMQANAQNIANSQDYARMQALQQLGGQYSPAAAQQTLAQFQNPSQAGTFAASKAYNVNAPEFQQNMQNAQNSYQNFVNSTVNPAQAYFNQQRQLQGFMGAFGGHYNDYNYLTDPARNALNAANSQAAGMRGGTFNIKPDEENS